MTIITQAPVFFDALNHHEATNRPEFCTRGRLSLELLLEVISHVRIRCHHPSLSLHNRVTKLHVLSILYFGRGRVERFRMIGHHLIYIFRILYQSPYRKAHSAY